MNDDNNGYSFIDIWLFWHLVNYEKNTFPATWTKFMNKVYQPYNNDYSHEKKDNQLYNKILHDIIGTKRNDLLWYEQRQLTIE